MRLVPMPIVMAMVAGIFPQICARHRALPAERRGRRRGDGRRLLCAQCMDTGRSASCRPSSALCSRGQSWLFGLDASPVSMGRPSGRAAALHHAGLLHAGDDRTGHSARDHDCLRSAWAGARRAHAGRPSAAVECGHHRGWARRPPQCLRRRGRTSLTGPTNGLITSTGPHERHYATATVTAVIAILFGLLAPTFTKLMLSAPRELILTLGGLAMLRVLLGAFTIAFRGSFAFGALVCFVVTVADKPVLNIGAAFGGCSLGSRSPGCWNAPTSAERLIPAPSRLLAKR